MYLLCIASKTDKSTAPVIFLLVQSLSDDSFGNEPQKKSSVPETIGPNKNKKQCLPWWISENDLDDGNEFCFVPCNRPATCSHKVPVKAFCVHCYLFKRMLVIHIFLKKKFSIVIILQTLALYKKSYCLSVKGTVYILAANCCSLPLHWLCSWVHTACSMSTQPETIPLLISGGLLPRVMWCPSEKGSLERKEAFVNNERRCNFTSASLS